MIPAESFPALNAALNACSAVLLAAGYVAVRRRAVRARCGRSRHAHRPSPRGRVRCRCPIRPRRFIRRRRFRSITAKAGGSELLAFS